MFITHREKLSEIQVLAREIYNEIDTNPRSAKEKSILLWKKAAVLSELNMRLHKEFLKIEEIENKLM